MKENIDMEKEFDLTKEEIEGKINKESCEKIFTNIIKKPKLLNFTKTYSLFKFFDGNKNFIDKHLVIELNKIVNQYDYIRRFKLNKDDKNNKEDLKKKVNLLYFLVTFILINNSYVSYFFPFLSETINFLYKYDEIVFIFKALENDPDVNIIERFKLVDERLKSYCSQFQELRETTPDSKENPFSSLFVSISSIINIIIEIEEDFRNDDFEEIKLFKRLLSKLKKNSYYFENNKNLRYSEIKCRNRTEKNQKIFELNEIKKVLDKESNEPYDVKIEIIGKNKDITNTILKINKKVFLCRFEI